MDLKWIDKVSDELVAHMFKRVYEKHQSAHFQQRIDRVLEGNVLDKLECQAIYLHDVDVCGIFCPGFNVYIANSYDAIEVSYPKIAPNDEFQSPYAKALNMFRSVDRVECKASLDDTDFADLLKIKTSIGNFQITNGCIRCDNKQLFFNFCKKYKPSFLDRVYFSPEFFCDEIFISVLPHTNIKLWHRYEEDPDIGEDLLSDRTLQALSGPKVPIGFALDRVQTAFTVQGIKNLVEKLIQRKLTVYYDLGVLNPEQEVYATQWVTEIGNMRKSKYRGYTIDEENIERGDETMHTFNIRFDTCDNHHNIEFRFKKEKNSHVSSK